jgi:FlaA1/EpsC-like NDP-sugar epimerase
MSLLPAEPTIELTGRHHELLRCLIVGAGSAGRSLARDLRRSPDFGLAPIGFVDDDPAHATIAGLPVLGGTQDIARVARQHKVDTVVIAIPSLGAKEIRRLAEQAASVGVAVRYLPSFVAALERDARISDLRRLRVDDLLGRREVHVVRPSSASVIADKRVLVTGAGGSIGSELCRQIKHFRPAALFLLDHDESNLHRVKMEIDGETLLDGDDTIIADIRDASRIHQVFRDYSPEVVFHAAAHKHLPLLERHPCEGAKSNVMGTHYLVEAAVAHGVERFILISTDKAADPTSILGATKRVAELIVQAHAGGTTRFAAVRFGNVLGSRGSFLTVLASQIENQQEITITHPDVTRFFMTIEEAVGLVIEAAAMADDGEVFVLDMGEPVRILDLVRNYAAQLHLSIEDLPIRYTGLRPGEKLNESLFSVHEERTPTAHPRIWATHSRTPIPEDLSVRLRALYRAAAANDAAGVRQALIAILPEYRPASEEELANASAALAAPYPDGF